MCKNPIAVFLFFLISPQFLSGQCIDSKTLRDKLISLKDFTGPSTTRVLQELLSYETASEHCSYRNDSTRILLLERIGKLYIQKAAYKQAIYYASKAVSIVDDNLLSPAIIPACQIKNYYNLAVAYDLLNKTTEKIKAYDSCIAVAKRLRIVNSFSLYSLLEKVRYQNNIGDYNLCISQADLGEMYSRQYIVGKDEQEYIDSTSYSFAFVVPKVNALLVLQREDEAELLLLHKIRMCNTKSAKVFLGVLYELLATTKMQQKNDKEALQYFNQALRCYKERKDTLSYKDIIHNMGFLYEDIYKNDKKALFYYKKAIGIKIVGSSRSKLDSINSLNIYSNIGNVYARNCQFDSAQQYFQYAFNLIHKGMNETEILHSPLDDFIRNQKVEYLTGLFINKGHAFYKQYITTKNPVFVNQAIRMFILTDRLLERIKANQFEIQSKLFWRKSTHPFYEEAIEACIDASKPEEAFYFFERSRAILLYDQMKEQRGFDEADILKQQELKNDINILQQQLASINPDFPEYKKVQNEISDLKDTQDYLLQQIKVRNPLYFNNFLDSNFTSLKETRKSILTDQTLVEIFAGDSCVYSMIVTGKNIYFNKINKADYDTTMYQCLAYMSDPALANSKIHFNSFVRKSRHLHDLIFQNKNLNDSRVIFSTDGHHFPFETLVTGSGTDGPVYFINKHSVSYTYSARYLMSQFSQNPSFNPGNFLGIAPVRFPLKNHLSVLPGSDIAIRDVASFFTVSDTLIKENATRNNFLKNFGRYQVIQLFSHSSESSSKGEPVIYFADEPLYLSELNNIKTPATKLVVLSACETGNGKFYRGEGVFSFNRAFAALGIPSCINNLWSVDNESTYKITGMFYKYIAKGLPIDVALQQAKLEFIKSSSAKKRLPYYWAATILAGKADTIQFNNKWNYLPVTLIVFGIIALSLLSIVVIHRWSRRNTLNKKRPGLSI